MGPLPVSWGLALTRGIDQLRALVSLAPFSDRYSDIAYS